MALRSMYVCTLDTDTFVIVSYNETEGKGERGARRERKERGGREGREAGERGERQAKVNPTLEDMSVFFTEAC